MLIAEATEMFSPDETSSPPKPVLMPTSDSLPKGITLPLPQALMSEQQVRKERLKNTLGIVGFGAAAMLLFYFAVPRPSRA